MYIAHKLFNILVLLILPLFLIAQTNDNILWSKLSVQKAINPKTTIIVAPIFRYNNNITRYQNFSLDYTYQYKLNKNFTVQLTGRTWLIPNGTNRQFIWPNLVYTKAFQKWQLNSLLRWHYAIDIDEQSDPDFIRWKSTATWLDLGKLKLYLGIEWWIRLNENKELQRIRYISGAGYKLTDQHNLSLYWWRQQSANINPSRNVNIFVLTLSHKI